MKALYAQHLMADRSQYGYFGIEKTFLKKICLSELNVAQTNKPVLLMELLLKSVQTGDPYSRYITYMYMYTMYLSHRHCPCLCLSLRTSFLCDTLQIV